MTTKIRVLVIDDDTVVTRSCQRILEPTCDLAICATGREGLDAIASETFSLALVDLKLPDMDGMEILRQAPDRFPDLPIIIITGYATIGTAVEAIKLGAFDYVAKPFTPDDLEATVENAVRQRRLLAEHRRLQDSLQDTYRSYRLIGESDAMKRVFSLIEQVAPTETTVLLTGESGTGKDLVARAIHSAGPRQDQRFVAVDCGAISPTLIASELFGHVSGAFTGAVADRTGLIQSADEGTLFLDEINNLPLDCQASLLRVLEDHAVRAVGASSTEDVDVRFIAATNKSLQGAAQDGAFREDLFYRLNVFPIHLPPLRDRLEDVPLLASHFLSHSAARTHKHIDHFTPDALELLRQYDWPGNVRELSNVVERAVILTSDNRIGKAHLQECLAVHASVPSVPQTMDELNEVRKQLKEQAVAQIERAFLIDALRRNGHSVTKAARQTGMQRTHFHALLKKHNLRLKDLASRSE